MPRLSLLKQSSRHVFEGERVMSKSKSSEGGRNISRERLAELLNEDLSREYQAIMSYVVYSRAPSS
jgi:hypothetical protein